MEAYYWKIHLAIDLQNTFFSPLFISHQWCSVETGCGTKKYKHFKRQLKILCRIYQDSYRQEREARAVLLRLVHRVHRIWVIARKLKDHTDITHLSHFKMFTSCPQLHFISSKSAFYCLRCCCCWCCYRRYPRRSWCWCCYSSFVNITSGQKVLCNNFAPTLHFYFDIKLQHYDDEYEFKSLLHHQHHYHHCYYGQWILGEVSKSYYADTHIQTLLT